MSLPLLGHETKTWEENGLGTDWVIPAANEAFSGFDNIGHNDLFTLIFLWIIPK